MKTRVMIREILVIPPRVKSEYYCELYQANRVYVSAGVFSYVVCLSGSLSRSCLQ